MAERKVIISDISGTELDDETHATVIVEHPDNRMPLRLDMSTDEAALLADSTLRLVSFTIHEPNKPVRRVQVETKTLDKLYKGVEFDKVLEGAPKAEVATATPRRTAAKAATTGEKIDYTEHSRFGQLHRGRVTDAEKLLVQGDKEQASKNREAQTGKPIDWNDQKEKDRYGL